MVERYGLTSDLLDNLGISAKAGVAKTKKTSQKPTAEMLAEEEEKRKRHAQDESMQAIINGKWDNIEYMDLSARSDNKLAPVDESPESVTGRNETYPPPAVSLGLPGLGDVPMPCIPEDSAWEMDATPRPSSRNLTTPPPAAGEGDRNAVALPASAEGKDGLQPSAPVSTSVLFVPPLLYPSASESGSALSLKMAAPPSLAVGTQSLRNSDTSSVKPSGANPPVMQMQRMMMEEMLKLMREKKEEEEEEEEESSDDEESEERNKRKKKSEKEKNEKKKMEQQEAKNEVEKGLTEIKEEDMEEKKLLQQHRMDDMKVSVCACVWSVNKLRRKCVG
jgi:hypothetical protein